MDSPKLLVIPQINVDDTSSSRDDMICENSNIGNACGSSICHVETSPLLREDDKYLKKEKTALPLKSIFVLSIVMISEPMIMTILFPFIYYMVKSFNISDDEKDIGMYAGLISSSFSFCQCLTSLLWGSLSDKIGRKPVLLIGLFGNFVSMLLFGFSKDLAWAITTRSISGFLSGNIGVAKCVLGEITDETNQHVAFAWYGLVFSVGQIIGPMIGGLLADPVRHHPEIFGNIQIFQEYPYLLPCLISALITAVGFIVGIFWLEESLHSTRVKIHDSSGEKNSCTSSTVNFPKFQGSVSSYLSNKGSDDTDILYGSHTSNKKANSINNIDDYNLSEIKSQSSFAFFDIPNASKHTILAYSILALSSILFEELFPLWTATRLPVGLSFTSKDIGMAMTATGIVDLFSQLLLYPILQDYFGLIALFRYSMGVFVIIHSLFPLVSVVAKVNGGDIHNPFVWITLIAFMGIRVTAACFGFTSIIIMVQNSCQTDKLGKVNGYGQMLASFFRGVGPAVGGALWTWSLKNGLDYFPLNHYFVFLLISVFSLTSFIHSFKFPKSGFRNTATL